MNEIEFGQEPEPVKPETTAAPRHTEIEFAPQEPADLNNEVLTDVKEMAHEHILRIIEKKGASFAKMDNLALEKFIQGEVQSLIYTKQIPLNDSEVAYVADSLYKEIAGFGPLEDLLSDPAVEDIMINGYKDVYVSKSGRMERVSTRFLDNNHLLRIVRRILAPLGRRLDESSPMVDARLPDGSRINVIISPLARDGVVVSIRKFRRVPLRAEDLMGLGTFDTRVYELMREAVRKRCNLVVSGATSTGKTSMLNVIAEFIPAGERLITIEDTAELQLNHHHVVRLESRPGGHEGAGSITIRDLVKNSLRMRPDRVIVGEVRGAEVLDMLQAMSTGHDGSMGTIHASTPRDCLHRLEMLSGFAGFTGNEASLRRQIASALDLIIQIVRLPSGKRRIYSITEVAGIVDDNILLQDLYRYESRVGPDGQELDNWVPVVPYPKNPKISHIRLT
ncbi:CpaF family protein [Limnobacter litoralis]|uniref:Type II/IV secretion system ATP-binding protein n=2 Tax=Limnobacter TaxID=131079 RepID=A0ABQ5YUA5_9BURK|nr:CpaF family protein [Limnobacter litoralis]GLR26876.1 type II/IV secretion system ATP-binding protein [Limnobacter litoralis]